MDGITCCTCVVRTNVVRIACYSSRILVKWIQKKVIFKIDAKSQADLINEILVNTP